MALKLNKLFVRVPGDVTVADISAVSVQQENQKKLYFLQNLHQIVNNGIAYGVDPNTVQSITDLQQLIGKSAKDQNENTIIERLSALEAIKVLDPSYVFIDTSANADGTNTPVINLNIVDITSDDHGLVDNKNAKGYIDAEVAKATTVVEAGKGIDVRSTTANDGHTIYTIDSSLTLTYTSATSGENAQPAKINLVDGDGTNVFGSINVSDIIGNGVLQSSDYDPSTGKLTLTFKNASGSTTTAEIDLHEMLDINDMSVETGSQKYLTVALSGSASEDGNSQAVFTVHTVDVSTVTAGTTALADAWQVKQYVDSQTTDLHVDVASKNDYIDASVDAENNKKVNIEANVSTLTADAGTRGTYSITDAGEVTLTGEVDPTLTGVTDTLTDGADVAAKVKTYVDGKVAAEAARTDANIEGAIKALDTSVEGTGTNVKVHVDETDGLLSGVTITETYATVSYTPNDNTWTNTNPTGLVTGNDLNTMKSYVDDKVGDTEISAQGDGKYIDASVDSTDKKKINVAANTANLGFNDPSDSSATLTGTTNTLVDGADVANKVTSFVNARIAEDIDALDSTVTVTDSSSYVSTTITEADGKLTSTGSSLSVTYGSMDGTTANNATGGIAKAEDVQDFVDRYDFWETYSASNNG